MYQGPTFLNRSASKKNTDDNQAGGRGRLPSSNFKRCQDPWRHARSASLPSTTMCKMYANLLNITLERYDVFVRHWHAKTVARLAVATKASSVACSLKLRHVDLGWYLNGWPPGKTWGCELGVRRRGIKSVTDRLYSRYRADTVGKGNKPIERFSRLMFWVFTMQTPFFIAHLSTIWWYYSELRTSLLVSLRSLSALIISDLYLRNCIGYRSATELLTSKWQQLHTKFDKLATRVCLLGIICCRVCSYAAAIIGYVRQARYITAATVARTVMARRAFSQAINN